MLQTIKKLSQWIRRIFVTIVILVALLTLIARASVPWLNHHREFFENWASHVLHCPISFRSVSVDWYWYEPRVHFHQVKISDLQEKKLLVSVGELTIGIHPVKSLVEKSIYPSTVILKNIELNLYPFLFQHKKSAKQFHLNVDKLKILSRWLSGQPDIYLQDVQLHWYMKRPSYFPFRGLAFKVKLTHHDISLVGAGFIKQQGQKDSPVKLIVSFAPKTLEDPKQANGKFYFRINDFDVKSLSHFPFLEKYSRAYHVLAGHFSIQSWVHFQEGKLKKINIAFQSEGVKFFNARTKNKLNFNVLNGQFYAEKQGNFWQGVLSNLNFKINDHLWPCKKIAFRFYLNAEQDQPQWLLTADKFNIEQITHLFSYFSQIPNTIKYSLDKLKPKGQLSAFYLIKLHQKSSFPFYISTTFKDISWLSQKNMPGLNHLSGSLNFSHQTGDIKLQAKRALFQWSKWFSHEVPLIDGQLEVNWQKLGKQQWNVHLISAESFNDNISWQTSGLIKLAGKSPPIINLKGNFSVNHLSKLKNYFPDRILNKDLLTWLRTAFVSGNILDGKFSWKGLLKDFPYRHGGGQFDLSMQLNKVHLHYQDGWPDLKAISGSLNTNGSLLNIALTSGDLLGAKVQNVQAVIADLNNPALKLSARVLMNFSQGMKFLKEAPLVIGKEISFLNLSGQSLLNLTFQLPIKDDANLSSLRGSFDLNDAKLNFVGWPITFDSLKGEVSFTNQGIHAKNIVGKFYGQPIRFDLNTPNNKALSVVKANLEGRFDTAFLYKVLKWPVQKYLSGAANYKASLEFDLLTHKTDFTLNSNLLGVGIHIPKVCQKVQEAIVPFSSNLKMNGKSELQVYARYNSNLSTALAIQKNKDSFKFLNGEIRFGPGKAKLQQLPGLVVSVNVQKADWSGWKRLFSTFHQRKEEKGDTGFSFSKIPLRVLHLNIASFTFLSHIFHQVDLHFYPRKEDLKLVIASPVISGECTVPLKSTEHVFRGSFSHFHVPAFSVKTKSGALSLHLNHLPDFNLQFNDFKYGNYALGYVKLKTSKITHGIQINQLKIKSNLLSAHAKGNWIEQQSNQTLRLTGQIVLNNVGKVLNDWKWTNSFEGGHGGLGFDLSWKNLFTGSMTRQGKIALNVLNGRIIHLNQQTESAIGLGEFLNVLSLQSLSHHLFDFSSWGKKGFGFDQLKGDFVVSTKKLSTQNAFVKSEVADIETKGSIDLDKQAYDLYLRVEPHLISSLPVLVGIIGTPIAGAATWFANKLVDHEVSKAVGSVYKITGPLNKPNIQKLKGNQIPVSDK